MTGLPNVVETAPAPDVLREREAAIAAIAGRWRGIGWELIRETPTPPALQMALDEVLLRRVGAGLRPPTLRFWAWASRAVIIGRFQSLRNEVDLEEARAMGVQVVRRLSGGGAMFVEPDRAITYSLYLPEGRLEGVSFVDSYEALDSWVVGGFRELGVKASYAPLNDITSPEGKIGGAAQARRAGGVLHHTTIAYEMSADDMLRVLRIGREKLSDKGITSAAKRVSPLRRQTDLSREAIVEHLIDSFGRRLGLVEGRLTGEELAEAERLAADKFATAAWTHDLP
ncbi:MAG: lipoate--protein ligase family protein [Chloroflexota bacterium]|nr:lipoate--protein ligase family protein [Chloroflexota bacterium]